ncbi:hypothetical protein [Streptomyces sp. WMMC905]|uniref:hypothetical protein n=1 Tax=Streptomyces sp. WMMC905 TaxID=3404123 RepID=UPI003B954D5E
MRSRAATTEGGPSVCPAPRERVRAVRRRLRRADGDVTVRDRLFTLYLLALFAGFFLIPALHAASRAEAPVSLTSPASAANALCVAAAPVCWAAQIAGRIWGPLLLPPLPLHVFVSTDLPPEEYLGPVARRRLASMAGCVLVLGGLGVHLGTDALDRPAVAAVAALPLLGAAALAATAWLWGQVRTVPENLALAALVGAGGLTVATTGRLLGEGVTGAWIVASAPAVTAAVVGRLALRSATQVDLGLLVRWSARADQARTYTVTGTAHHALDLYRPEPRGLGGSLLRPDGRPRGPLSRGAVRAARTPGRTGAGIALTAAAGVLSAVGAAEGAGGPAAWLWVSGAFLAYLGAGWVSEAWRDVRDQSTLPPLFGGGWWTRCVEALAWPLLVVVTVMASAAALTTAARWPAGERSPGETCLLIAGSAVLVLGARYLREMKSHLPLRLLTPLPTPMGDLSGPRLLLWQFDGVVVVVVGAALTHAMPSAARATGLAFFLAACCVWAGVRRAGRPGVRDA